MMAYPTYPYPGYQPAPYYSQPVPDQLAQLRMQQQNQMMQGPQPPQIQTMPTSAGPITPGGPQNNGMILVSGRQEADGYLIAPNSAIALWDQNNPVVYLRKADSTGKPSTVVYDLVERTDNPAPQQTAAQVDLSRYVTIEQLEEILSERLKRPAKPAKSKEDE